MKKSEQYAGQILAAIQEMFQADSENHIDLNDFEDDNNLKDFFHALANIVPTFTYNKLTGADENQLSFNHIANRICFENSVKA